MGLSRRSFLAVTAAAACVGCSADHDAPAPAPAPDAGGDDEPGGSFGDEIDLGPVEDVEADIDRAEGFLYVPEARGYIVRFPAAALEAAADVYDEVTLEGMDAGFVALYQRCTHLGCRVPHCATSKRFECPCHNAVFNRVGELVEGPARRGLDRFPIRVEDGRVLVDTSTILEGLPAELSTVSGDPAGPTCIGS